MSDYKEYSCPSIKRFDFSQLPAGRYELKAGKIVRVDDDPPADVNAAGDRFIEALKRLAEQP